MILELNTNEVIIGDASFKLQQFNL